MSKTPEELAEEYLRYENESHYWAKHAFLAGYQAAKDQLFEESGFRLRLFKDEADAKAAYQEALDEIPEQAAFEDGYRLGAKESQPQWISVKDRLPSKDDDALWFNPTLYRTMCVDCISPQWNADLEHNTYTHWMPLPEPPKDAKE